MAGITITKADVQKARDYMPLLHKETMAKLLAKLCVRIVPSAASRADRPLPDRAEESRAMRQKCLMGVLIGWYFQKEFEHETLTVQKEGGGSEEKPINFCASADEVDKWAGSHVINQMERLKKEKDCANKIYNILYDYKCFEGMLVGAIREELETWNDPAGRMADMLAQEVTPESVKEVVEMLDGARKQRGDAEHA